ncbi:NADH-quinone oxidoreductase subunit NuoN [Chitinilyticum piscinae]|uniref:NADH-quinone oxidoreductase subunit N n=1 Tax=Chitinilyticum piscinae TaxID=2866724 RepID=A0A8J7FFM8_9NEIS|nr:NADH-quinone oxidoreductase subunit NuoN [Chitinilyticum piscinae]MBE9608493.1 NADH-quinone oxidoreductase subunit NuoN [Chitinilyticum piscinae]
MIPTSLNAWVATPEIFLLCSACIVLLFDLFVSESRKQVTYLLTLLVLALTAVLTIQSLQQGLMLAANGASPARYAFSNMYVADPVADFAKIGMVLGVALVLIYGRGYAQERGIFKGELFTLTLFSLLGMMVMASATNFLTLYVGLELLSLAIYALVAMPRNNVRSTEAAMKYFVLGALASGMLLYGLSMLYGATGSLDIYEVASRIIRGEANPMLVTFGTVFVVTGIGFKLGAVPFHMWVPDVYEGAPTLLAQLIGSAPKLAAFVFVLRLLGHGLAALGPDWGAMLIIMAVLSLVIGNLAAIAQKNIKRMLAYSTISHMGFVLLGFLVYNAVGYAASFFYVMTYVITAAASFGLLMLMSRSGFECENIDDFKGLNKRNPWYALMMLMVMFSMAGIPAFVGFFAKLSVLRALVGSGFTWLAIVAVVFSLIGAFYYLRVVKVMYFDEPEADAPVAVGNLDAQLILSANCLLLLALGVFPNQLLTALSYAVKLSMASAAGMMLQ